jgi:hypothetical protein
MAISTTFLIVAGVAIVVWLVLETKRLKHKLVAIFLIGLLLLTYFGFGIAIKGKDLDLTSVSGMTEAGKLYFVWLGNAFVNLKHITAYAVNQNWSEINETQEEIIEENKENVSESIWEKLK